MRAIHVESENGQPRLVWASAPDPIPGPADVLVAVRATAVNRADLSQARGHYPPPPGASDILGLEMAGEIVALGHEVSGWSPGDRVCALLPGGGYASLATVHQAMLLPLPADWSYAMAAAVPEVWYTAFVNLFLEGVLQPGERVLIHAGASGVGTAAIQLAHHAGAHVFATAGSPEKVAGCQALGAALAVNYKESSFREAVFTATGGQGVHLILDPVGAAYLDDNLRLLQEHGRLVHIGSLGGRKAEIDLGLVLGKSLRLLGSRLRPRPLAEKIAITGRFRAQVWPLLVSGQLRPIIDRLFPIEEAGAAHDYVRRNANIGKVILEVGYPPET
jgi:putative PIG3 family NAD(P)H quinone oxidoreductase